ncbi:MAG: SAVED domain-containing protein [Armatimonadetes bacterium]|nr:SAVED domain-containing protein [Armatimonadota bacterium]
MANQTGARLKGDDYQHITTWLHVLELKYPRYRVRLVTVEDETSGSADDITVRYSPESGQPDRFYQVKFHTTHAGAYSTEALLKRKRKGTSLLTKLFATWKKLKDAEPEREVELHLVSNWSWSAEDAVATQIDGETNKFRQSFLTVSNQEDAGKARNKWQAHLEADATTFARFIQDIRLCLGAACFTERARHASERMANLGLKHDEAALLVAVGIVRGWIKSGLQQVTHAVLDEAITANDLRAETDENCRIVHLTTIKKQSTDLRPDYVIDWRVEFEGQDQLKGHAPKVSNAWNEKFLPELHRIEGEIAEESGVRLIRARGLARLSAWFAFGYVFSEVSRYVIEVDQYGNLWRTDSAPSNRFEIVTSNMDGEVCQGNSDTVAVGISITGDLSSDVRDALSDSGLASHLLLLSPKEGPGRDAFVDAGDVVTFARQTKTLISSYVRQRKAKRVCIFYYGPLSGACFLGSVMNAVGAEIQIMEAQYDRTYLPSFLLA